MSHKKVVDVPSIGTSANFKDVEEVRSFCNSGSDTWAVAMAVKSMLGGSW